MAKELPPFVQNIVDKFSNSRDFTISFTLHAIVVAMFGGSWVAGQVLEWTDPPTVASAPAR